MEGKGAVLGWMHDIACRGLSFLNSIGNEHGFFSAVCTIFFMFSKVSSGSLFVQVCGVCGVRGSVAGRTFCSRQAVSGESSQ